MSGKHTGSPGSPHAIFLQGSCVEETRMTILDHDLDIAQQMTQCVHAQQRRRAVCGK